MNNSHCTSHTLTTASLAIMQSSMLRCTGPKEVSASLVHAPLPRFPDARQKANKYLDPNRDATMTGEREIRSNYDYAHSVFPLSRWRHSVGAFEISDGPLPNYPSPLSNTSAGGNERAYVHWNWRVDWRANTTGVVSTGTYDDVFEKRNGEWKVLAKVSRDDANWPLYLFEPYVVSQAETYQSSCGDTSL